MSKYIDAEKFYKKVDELMAHYAKVEKDVENDIWLSLSYRAKVKMCSEIIDLITSLQQERPEVDFKKEIGRWMDKLDDKYCMLVENYSIQDIKDTARHFYELGLNTRKEE